jgi:hypothetical protein
MVNPPGVAIAGLIVSAMVISIPQESVVGVAEAAGVAVHVEVGASIATFPPNVVVPVVVSPADVVNA